MMDKQTILIAGATGSIGEVLRSRWQNVALELCCSGVGSRD